MPQADLSPDRFRDLLRESEPTFEEVLACVFDLQPHEARTYEVLRDNPASTVEELAAELDRDRSNVNRSLLTLREKALVERTRRLLDSGGHVYQYTATDIDETRELMHETLDAWAGYVHDRIDEFGSEPLDED